MFNVKVGSNLIVSYARKGKKQDGTPYAVVAFVEKDNQPKDLENPSQSKSVIKCWMDSLPDDVVDGCTVKLTELGGCRNIESDRGDIAGSKLLGQLVRRDVAVKSRTFCNEAKARGKRIGADHVRVASDRRKQDRSGIS
jgi:hypothetical protein